MLLAFGTEFSYGQEHTCVLPSLPSNSNSQKTSSGIEDGAEKRFPVNGSINALIVFVHHQDDTFEHCAKLLVEYL